MADKNITDVLNVIFQANKMLSESLLQLSGRVDALKAIVCELHPEIAEQLEAQIQKEQNESLRKFAELQQKCELILPTLSDSVN